MTDEIERWMPEAWKLVNKLSNAQAWGNIAYDADLIAAALAKACAQGERWERGRHARAKREYAAPPTIGDRHD